MFSTKVTHFLGFNQIDFQIISDLGRLHHHFLAKLVSLVKPVIQKSNKWRIFATVMPAQNKQILYQDLDLIDYKTCWDFQEELQQKIVLQKTENRSLPEQEQKLTDNYLLLVEHPHVYTMGKSGDENHLLVNDVFLKSINATYYKINRGGDITYHGPGQLVVYPILDLENFFTDIHKYLRLLEEVVIKILADYNIIAGRSSGETGVWLDADTKQARKICAMGVHCSRWVTKHGLALNINADLNYFNHIIPCGIADKAVTSLEKELSRKIDMNEVKQKFTHYFAEIFDAELTQKLLATF